MAATATAPSAPRLARDPLGGIAAAMLACWCAVGLAFGGHQFYLQQIWHPMVVSQPLTDNWQPPGATVQAVLLFGWIFTLNLLALAAVLGAVRIWRLGPQRTARTIGYLLVMAAAAAGTFWGLGHSLGTCALVLVVAFASYPLLRPFARTGVSPVDVAQVSTLH